MEKEVTHDGNNLIIPHQCSSTGVSLNMQLCSVSFKGSVRGPRRFFVYYQCSATAGIWLKSGVKRVHSIWRLVTPIMIATFVH